MNGTALTTERTPQVIATEINSIKSQTRNIMLQASIEIGRRLIEAKALVPHGEWGNWLQESVDYSDRTAQNLMRIYTEYGNKQIGMFDEANAQALADLSYSQAVALLGIPVEERVDFVEEHDAANMSTRELQQVIKERDELRERLDKSQSAVYRVTEEKKKLQQESSDLQSKYNATNGLLQDKESTVKMLKEELEKERQRTKSEVERLVGLLDEARAAGGSPEQLKKLEEQLQQAQAQVEELTAELNKPVTMEAAVIEKVPEEVQQELDALREKVKNGDQKAAAQLKFRIIFDVIVKDIGDILAALEDIKKTAPPKEYEKYENAVLGLAEKMVEKV